VRELVIMHFVIRVKSILLYIYFLLTNFFIFFFFFLGQFLASEDNVGATIRGLGVE
jgi:hypothetical protein